MNLRIAYFHSIGGASGDMILGALLDAGAPFNVLKNELEKLHVRGFSLSKQKGQRAGLIGTQVIVELDEGLHPSKSRTVSDFVSIIQNSSLEGTVKNSATQVLNRIGEAEKKAHRLRKNNVVLHEMGSLDTLIDVVGTIIALTTLNIEKIYASPLLMGNGIIKSSHGTIPAPGPATLELVAGTNAIIIPPPPEESPPGELTTPTGAALLTTLASFSSPPMTVEKIGYGLGSRDSPSRPNALGIWIGEQQQIEKTIRCRLLETNLDDATPETLAYTQEQLFDLGAVDVWFTPIQMKKGRPGTLLSTLVPITMENSAVEIIFRETPTLGIRVRTIERYEALREVKKINSTLGLIEVKVKKLGNEIIGISPEYESCRKVAQNQNIPLSEVYRIITNEAWSQITSKTP